MQSFNKKVWKSYAFSFGITTFYFWDTLMYSHRLFCRTERMFKRHRNVKGQRSIGEANACTFMPRSSVVPSIEITLLLLKTVSLSCFYGEYVLICSRSLIKTSWNPSWQRQSEVASPKVRYWLFGQDWVALLFWLKSGLIF